mgnify:CR=1 FL=1
MMSLKDTYDEYTKNISKKYSIDLDYVREFIDYSSILENESKMIDEYNERTLKQKKEFVEDVTKKLKSGNHTPCDFARIRVNPHENDWAVDGVRTVDSRPFFNWIREECNYILVTF